MKTYKNLYQEIYLFNNLFLAYKKARKGKTKKDYVKEFEKNLNKNLLKLSDELKNQTYTPRTLETFILRDPKTRRISKSDFRDRIIHHAFYRIIEPLFEKVFIYDSCANRIGKGTLSALKRFKFFIRKVTKNGKVIKNKFNDNNFVRGYCLKADIKHYFNEVNHKILIKILSKKIMDKKVIGLVKKILGNGFNLKGMPLGNLTSQFFANVYLNELDYYVKHKLKAKHYIRYVDDFAILHKSKSQLIRWKREINRFLFEKLQLKLHPDKSRIISLSKGVDFVGFRNFYYFRLLRKRNINNMVIKVGKFNNGLIDNEEIMEIFQGWNAYAKWANSYKIRRKVLSMINKIKLKI